jgi:hypothetical protein
MERGSAGSERGVEYAMTPPMSDVGENQVV